MPFIRIEVNDAKELVRLSVSKPYRCIKRQGFARQIRSHKFGCETMAQGSDPIIFICMDMPNETS